LHYRCLAAEDFDAIYDTFVEAFSDYQVKIQITKKQFRELNIRRGLNYGLSVGAFDENNRMAGLLLNGVDLWENKLTAYDMGTGVIPEFRRMGIANKMFDFLLPKLQQARVRQYLLEVIRSNQKAYDLYKKKGFRETRQFECFRADVKSLDLKKAENAESSFSIKPMEKLDWILFESFWDWHPSWQNSTNSMKRCVSYKTVLGTFFKNKCVGYAIFYPESGDIAQMAVDKKFRRKGVGSLLTKEISARASEGRLAFLNVDSSSAETISFLTELGFKNFVGQFEMILEL
jgi:ribosomal protein S18 acetylase RimI-like enzyme